MTTEKCKFCYYDESQDWKYMNFKNHSYCRQTVEEGEYANLFMDAWEDGTVEIGSSDFETVSWRPNYCPVCGRRVNNGS